MPHAKLFAFDRQVHKLETRLTPSWLLDSNRVIFNDIRANPPLAQEVELIQSNDSSAQIKLLDGQNLEVKTEHLYPIDQGAKDHYQAQQVVDLTDENDPIGDISDTESDIYCLNGEEPSQPGTTPNLMNGGTSPMQPPASPKRPVIIPFTMRSTQDSNMMGEFNSPNSSITQSSGGSRPDSPPITRFRSHQDDMVLRSGRTLRQK